MQSHIHIRSHFRVVERQHMAKRRANGRSEKETGTSRDGKRGERQGSEGDCIARAHGGRELRFPPRCVITRHYPPIKSLSNNYLTVAVTHTLAPPNDLRPSSALSPSLSLAPVSSRKLWAWLTSNQSVSISEPLLDDCVGNHCSRLITEIPYPLIRSNENVARY